MKIQPEIENELIRKLKQYLFIKDSAWYKGFIKGLEWVLETKMKSQIEMQTELTQKLSEHTIVNNDTGPNAWLIGFIRAIEWVLEKTIENKADLPDSVTGEEIIISVIN